MVCGLVAPARAGAAAGWRWPLAGHPVVARGFDPPALPWGAGHRGVDLRGRRGAPVYAAGAGVVGYAGLLAGRGVVTVHHPGGLESDVRTGLCDSHRRDAGGRRRAARPARGRPRRLRAGVRVPALGTPPRNRLPRPALAAGHDDAAALPRLVQRASRFPPANPRPIAPARPRACPASRAPWPPWSGGPTWRGRHRRRRRCSRCGCRTGEPRPAPPASGQLSVAGWCSIARRCSAAWSTCRVVCPRA